MYSENLKVNNQISIWLISMFWIISAMIVVGGLTRLTDSGLSITQWQLFTGFLPPLIFKGEGALTDFGPMLKNLRLVYFGAAAQIGIFTVLVTFSASLAGIFSSTIQKQPAFSNI